MHWPWIIISLVAGFSLSEWPRWYFSSEDEGVTASELARREDRRAASFFVPFVFALTGLFALGAFSLAWWIAPQLSSSLMEFWGPLAGVGASGCAVGTFEIGSGLSPARWVSDANSTTQRFRVDAELARRIGTWRVISCVSSMVVVLIGGHLFL